MHTLEILIQTSEWFARATCESIPILGDLELIRLLFSDPTKELRLQNLVNFEIWKVPQIF